MPTTIKLKNSVTTTNAPSSLAQGEVAINITDKKVWVGNAATTPIQIAGAGTTGNAAGSNTQVQYNSSGSFAGSANFTFNGTTVTMANDASISGLTVGKGGGAVSGSTALGNGSLAVNTTGQNTAVGYQSLYTVTTGTGSCAFGNSALKTNTANYNNAFGENALVFNTTGANNNAFGTSALQSNTTGGLNVAIGRDALFSNTTADANVAIGYEAAYTQTTGALYTVAVGYRALKANTSGSQNNGFGFQALTANTTGSNNSGFGSYALASTTTGGTNTAVGNEALRFNTTGGNNVGLGYQALVNNTTASYNTAVGYQAGYSNTVGQYNVFIGYLSGYSSNGTGNTNNTAVGALSMQSMTTGVSNSAFGINSLNKNTTGGDNTALGVASLYNNTTGASNIAVGQSSLYSNTTASNNVAVGYQALYSSTSGNGQNVAIGRGALYGVTTGYENIGIGMGAGESITTGYRNTFVGDDAGYLVTGNNNTIIGRYTGNNGGLDIRTASNYIVLSDGDGNPRGYFDGNGTFVLWQTVNGNQARLEYRNYNAKVWHSACLTTTTPDFRIYNQNSNGVYISWDATSWSSSSDERLKNITGNINNGLTKVNSLRAVNFTWKSDNTNTDHVGLIAQDVQAVLPQAVSQDESGNLGVRYTEVIPLLVAAIKDLKTEVDSLKAQLNK